MKFDIVKNLPVPKTTKSGEKGRNSLYPFHNMEIGDCLKFECTGRETDSYRRIYQAARNHLKRWDSDYDFHFAQIDESHFGCWKVKKDANSSKSPKRVRRTNAELYSISAQSVHEALVSEGTYAGAARRLGLHPLTFMRLLKKLGMAENKF